MFIVMISILTRAQNHVPQPPDLKTVEVVNIRLKVSGSELLVFKLLVRRTMYVIPAYAGNSRMSGEKSLRYQVANVGVTTRATFNKVNKLD